MKNAGLAYLLAWMWTMPPLSSQSSLLPPAADTLKVQALNGEATINNIRQRVAQEIQVQVTDESDSPIANATVSLVSPAQGPSGTFVDGSRMSTATTDLHGRAIVKGFRPNAVPGKFQIAVAVAHQGKTGHTTITQFNMAVEKASRKMSRGKIVTILAVVGAAAAGGAYAGFGRSSSQPAATATAPPAIVITPGTGIVSAPR